MAARDISEADVRAMLGIIGELSAFERAEDFRAGALPGLRELVPCEIATYNEVDFDAGSMIAEEDPVGAMIPGAAEIFVRLGHQNPLIPRYQRTRDGQPYKWSDLITRRELHRTELYHEAYKLMDVEYQMAFCLSAPPDTIIGLALSRARRDFNERDRTVLDLMRAPMIQALRTVERYAALTVRLTAMERGLEQKGAGVVLIERRGEERVVEFASQEAQHSLALEGSSGLPLPGRLREWLAAIDATPSGSVPTSLAIEDPSGSGVAVHLLPARDDGPDALLVEPVGEMLSIETLRGAGLTPREAEVISLVALGHSDAEIAAQMIVSARTVHKHLQNAYEKLGVRSRTQAVQVAWSIKAPALGP